ncbi:MAG: VanZ family protein [Chitinophagaceae bacterium]
MKVCFLVLYFVPFIYIVFFARRRQHIENRFVNLVPVRNFYSYYHDATHDTFYNFYSNLLGNVILFLPLPFILFLIVKVKKTSTVILLGFLLSFMIELLQSIFVIGVSDIDDILLNTFGTSIGAVICKSYMRLKSRRMYI